jgi:hypothetical protein
MSLVFLMNYKMMKLRNVFDLQVSLLGIGPHPVLLDLCTDCKNEKLICEVILAHCSDTENKYKSK